MSAIHRYPPWMSTSSGSSCQPAALLRKKTTPRRTRSNGMGASLLLRNTDVPARGQTVQAVPQKVTSGNLTLASSNDLPRPSSCQ
jgi:hypothetical protein